MTNPARHPAAVVSVVLAPACGRLLAEQLALLPTATRLAQSVAASGTVTVTGLWRGTRSAPAGEAVQVGGIWHVSVADASRLGWRLALRLRGLQPDVVHLHGFLQPLPAVVACLAVRFRARKPVTIVVQHHGEPPGRGRTRLAQRLLGRLIDVALFTGSEGDDSQVVSFRQAGILRPSTPVREVLEASTDLAPGERTEARKFTGVQGEPAVLWVGRLIASKDPQTAVAAFRQLLADRPGARLWMLTTDRALEPLIRCSLDADPALAAAVTLLGPIPTADMARWFRSCDLYLSTSQREGSGYALVEALACGVTPVVTELAAFRSIAGPLGSRFPAGDVDACARALRDTEAHPRQAVVDYFEATLSWPVVAQQFLSACGVPIS